MAFASDQINPLRELQLENLSGITQFIVTASTEFRTLYHVNNDLFWGNEKINGLSSSSSSGNTLSNGTISGSTIYWSGSQYLENQNLLNLINNSNFGHFINVPSYYISTDAALSHLVGLASSGITISGSAQNSLIAATSNVMTRNVNNVSLLAVNLGNVNNSNESVIIGSNDGILLNANQSGIFGSFQTIITSSTNSTIVGSRLSIISGGTNNIIIGGEQLSAQTSFGVALGGAGNVLNSFASYKLGAFSETRTGQTASSWVWTDELFSLGYGFNTPSLSRRNALTIFKNGTIEIGRATNNSGGTLNTGSPAVTAGRLYRIDDDLIWSGTKLNNLSLQTTGNSTTNFISQSGITNLLTGFVSNSRVVTTTGTSTTNIMSQGTVNSNYLANGRVVQTTGTSTSLVMSQSGVTRLLDNLQPFLPIPPDSSSNPLYFNGVNYTYFPHLYYFDQGSFGKIGFDINGFDYIQFAGSQFTIRSNEMSIDALNSTIDLSSDAGSTTFTNFSGVEFNGNGLFEVNYRARFANQIRLGTLLETPVDGDIIYDANRFQGYQNGAWVDFAPAFESVTGTSQTTTLHQDAITQYLTAIQDNTAVKFLALAGGTLAGNLVAPAITANTYTVNIQNVYATGTSVNIDLNSSDYFNVFLSGLTGNFTFDYSGGTLGTTKQIRFMQGATVRQISFTAGKYSFPFGIAPSLTAQPNATDVLSMISFVNNRYIVVQNPSIIDN